MVAPIAIVGMACRYPDARTPDELWENVLAQRRAFRRIPPERLRLEDYFSAERDTPDCVYSSEAALIENYEFDRVGFRVAGAAFRAADLTHWLALDVASQALSDGGFDGGDGLPREQTAVFLGNTLTGEFSRANVMRLRWPYVRRVVEGGLVEKGWDAEARASFLHGLEATYKKPFPPLGEESLAGGLSNTIAGRICNHFDLKGGGYTVDGACASSLLAVANACSALVAGDADVALAGGVDLSIDPFELVGFAKTGALASNDMRVYDARSEGFWPGEGCGFVVLMRHEDALAERRHVYALVRGWGISSDGHGGITRPEVEGQMLALKRAYDRAGFGIETVGYFEGHGTGTSVGDAAELKALTLARRRAQGRGTPAAIGSVKANIGHTKAAAGVAGLIKATLAVGACLLPPTTGCREPHAEFNSEDAALRPLKAGRLWADSRPLRAGISAMGFGGINAHLAIEGLDGRRRASFSAKERSLLSSHQDAELLVLSARDREELRREVTRLADACVALSRAEVGDLAARLAQDLDHAAPVRAALVASTPAELVASLEKLSAVLASDARRHVDGRAGVFFDSSLARPRIGFLFPGQGSPVYLDGGAWGRRFDAVRRLYDSARLPAGAAGDTSVAQPAVVAASLAGLRVLEELDVRACVAVGHSLGELTALHWAGALDEEAVLRVARARGEIMAAVKGTAGAMASVAAGRARVEALLNGDPVVIAGVNSPSQTVVSGERNAVESFVRKVQANNLDASLLPVLHAFHSPLMESSFAALNERLSHEALSQLREPVVSTVTGALLGADADLRSHLCRQVTSPVLFMEALTAAEEEEVALWIEVGPGHVLGGLAAGFLKTPVVSLDSGGESLRGLLLAAGAAFVLRNPTNLRQLFAGRFNKPFKLDRRPSFFANPCEQAPVHTSTAPAACEEKAPPTFDEAADSTAQPDAARPATDASPLDLFIQLVAARAELPPSAVNGGQRLLSDLHLNSITVTRLVAEAARQLGLPRPLAPTLYADATLNDVAEVLSRQLREGPRATEPDVEGTPAGFGTWVRPFTVELLERPLPRRTQPVDAGSWRVFAPDGYQFGESLRRAFAGCGRGKGVVVCLPPEPDESHVGLLIEAASAVMQAPDGSRFVLAQRGGVFAPFARTLHLETKVTTAVIDAPSESPSAAQWVVAEALAAHGYAEACYDPEGRRSERVLRALSMEERGTEIVLTRDDVLLVTGGAKGITAECALALATGTGARLALFGLSGADSSAEVRSNLERLAGAGVRFKYYSVDVTDEAAVRSAVARVEAELGPVTAILHGAAKNEPLGLGRLDADAFRRVLDVKVGGARNLLASIDPERLRLFVTFGSIIAHSGLPGEAHYGVANAWLARTTEEWQAAHPSCRCLCVVWSLWSGVGMGVRLGNMDGLVQQGISPIPPAEGVEMLGRLLARRLPAVSVVVMSRLPEMPTFKLESSELPLLRFLEQPRVYYPRVELVVDVELSTGADPYLEDHQLGGERLLPAVLGLEAMAQAAAALVAAEGPPSFEEAHFYRPVVVAESSPTRIRLAALVREAGVVDVALRSEETDFQVDHFRATCRFARVAASAEDDAARLVGVRERDGLDLDPVRDLYGSTLFHRGRFRRLQGYRALEAKECVAAISPEGEAPWFGSSLPQRLLLGDPGARDAAIHAIQACIPHRRLLPIGAEKISFFKTTHAQATAVRARERSRDGDTFVYDMEVIDGDGRVLERWEGLSLKAVEDLPVGNPLPWSLLGPFVERRVQELVHGSALSVAVRRRRGEARGSRSEEAMQTALGEESLILRRADGAPVVAGTGGTGISAGHARDLTLAVAGAGAVGCDIEFVEQRPPNVWLDLLGAEGFKLARAVADAFNEDEAVAATRVWVANESLRKAGASLTPVLTLVLPGAEGGWVTFSSGRLAVATLVARVRDFEEPLAIGVIVDTGGRAEVEIFKHAEGPRAAGSADPGVGSGAAITARL